MKTATTIFAMVAVTIMSVNVMAAPAGIREVRNLVIEKDKTATTRNAVTSLKGKNNQEAVLQASRELNQLSGRLADEAGLKAAMERVDLKVKNAKGEMVKLALGGIAVKLLKIDQTVKEIRENMRDLSPAAKAHLEALEQAVGVGAQFMAMASRTSDKTQLGKISAEKAEAVELYSKQLSILGDIATMETADIKAHTKVMADAVKEQNGPRGEGDVAFVEALTKSVNGDKAKLEQKKKDLKDCI